MSPRIKKALLWCVGSVVAITVATILFVPDIDVRITEDQVRDAIEERVPLEHDTGLFVIEVKEAGVQFIGDRDAGAVGLQAEVRVSSFGLGGKGSADTVSRLRYSDGAFYLTDLRLDDFEVNPTAATRMKLMAWKKAVETFLDDLGEEILLKDGEAAFEQFMRDRDAVGPLLREALDNALGEVPVYRLDRSPAQSLVWLALKDVRFEDHAAVAVLSPAQAILTLATGFLIVLCGGVFLVLSWAERRDPVDSELH